MERRDTWELAFGSKADGNPFVDYEIRGVFSGDNKVKTVEGFYDGGCTYKIRFMPSFEGKYRYRILAAFPKRKYDFVNITLHNFLKKTSFLDHHQNSQSEAE